MKRYLKIILIIVIVVALGIAIRQFSVQRNLAARQELDPRLVREVQKGSLKKTVSASGYVEPVRKRDLSFEISGIIEEVRVEEGQRVREGQVLLVLDDDQQRLNYLKAENDYKTAKISGTQAGIEQSKLNLDIARENLEATELKAPFTGLITKLIVEEGDFVNTGGVVGTIIDPSAYQVEVNVEESDIAEVQEGQEALITMVALPDREFRGQVVDMARSAVTTSGVVTLPVTVVFDKVDEAIRPGLSADVEIIVGSVEGQVVVPITAIIKRNGRELVMKVEDGKPVPTPVQTGLSDGLRVVVKSGLKSGDQIVFNAEAFSDNMEESGQQRMFPMPPRPQVRRGF